MLDRGLRGASRRASSAPRPRRGDAPDPTSAARNDLTRPADVHDRPGDARATSTTRSRAEPLGDGTLAGLGPHRRRHRLRAARLAARPRGLPARDAASTSRRRSSRCSPRRCPTTPARCARTSSGWPSPSRWTCTAPRSAGPPSTARGSAPTPAWTTSRSTGSSPARRPRRTHGRARWPRRARPRPPCSARREARGALTIEGSEPEFALRPARPRRPASARPSQTESHRLIEHLMIAANEQVAGLLSDRDVPTLYRVHERPEPAAVRAAAGPARLARRADAAGAGDDVAVAGGRHRGGVLACSSTSTCAARGRGRRALTALVLRALKQAHYSPREHRPRRASDSSALLPLHLADPPLPRPHLPTASLLSAIGGGRGRAAGQRAGRGGRRGRRARERDAMAIERDADDVARCFLLERELFEGGWEQVFAGEVIGLDRRRRVRRLRRRATRACSRCGGCAATGGSSTRRARSSSGRAAARRSASATSSPCACSASTPRAGGSTWTSSSARSSLGRRARLTLIARLRAVPPPAALAVHHAMS